MGYYVSLTSANWEIEDNPRSLQAIRSMPTKYRSLMRGGSSNGEKWFSWMNNADIENAKCVEDVFKALGFSTEPGSKPNTFMLTAYDSKTGQEDLFILVMAPWTTEGSNMEWTGEDNEMWRYYIEDGKLMYQQAQISWNDSEPYLYRHIHIDPSVTLNQPYATRFGEILIGQNDPALDSKLEEAQKWADKAQAYYENLRAIAKEQEEATA